MVFLSDFDGDPREYLTTFGFAVAPGMRWTFRTCEGFPGPRPTRRLVDFVEQHRIPELLRYSAYPDATVRDVDSALLVAERVNALRLADRYRDGRRFAAAYDKLLDALSHAPVPPVPSLLSSLYSALFSQPTVGELTVVVPLKPGASVGSVPATAFDAVPGTHFARVAVVPVPLAAPSRSSAAGECLLVSAVFDHGKVPYLDRLVAGLARYGDELWSGCVGYPRDSGPGAVARWLEFHRMRPVMFVATHPATSVGDIRAALDLRERTFDLVAQTQGQPMAEIREALRALWRAPCLVGQAR